MFGKTVDSITKSFFKMASDLENLVDEHNKKIDLNNEAIGVLNADNAVLYSEKIRAQKVSTKIQELLSI